MCLCMSGLGVLIGEREAPAVQLSFLLPPSSKQGRRALCLLIPTLLLPKGDAALARVKTGGVRRGVSHGSCIQAGVSCLVSQ